MLRESPLNIFQWRQIVKRTGNLVFVAVITILLFIPAFVQTEDIALYYPPEWKAKGQQARDIANALSKGSGLTIKAVVVDSYPEIITAFSKSKPSLVYAGSFLQAVLQARGLSTTIVQAIDGKEFYTSLLIAPSDAGKDPVSFVKNAGASIAYAKGTSSGESGAKAATGGKASVAVNNHVEAVVAVTSGKAKGAFVKDWWWKANQKAFKDVSMFEYPGVSDKKNPDNVLSANKSIAPQDVAKIKAAAMKSAKAFQVSSMKDFNASLLGPTLSLMKQGGIDPKTYSW